MIHAHLEGPCHESTHIPKDPLEDKILKLICDSVEDSED